MKLSGMTVRDKGKYLRDYGARSIDPRVANYLVAGGKALIEIAPLRNAVLHSSPVMDGDNGDILRLRRMRWSEDQPASTEVYLISDEWLDRVAQRIDDIHVELSELRPPLGYRGAADVTPRSKWFP